MPCCGYLKTQLGELLASRAVLEASGLDIVITDDENMPELVARKANERHEPQVSWDDLPARIRKRLCYKAKRWLNTRAVDQMTVARLAERDGGGEVRSWLATIADLGGR